MHTCYKYQVSRTFDKICLNWNKKDFITTVICTSCTSFLQRSSGIQVHVYVTDFQM